MTPGSPDGAARRDHHGDRGDVAPVLVLAIGNLLLGDDAVGVRLLAALCGEVQRWGDEVDLVDGGTQGLMLLGHLERRRAVLLLDAAALGAEPGTVHALEDEAVLAAADRPGGSAHEMGAAELLRAAALTGVMPPRVALVAVEPADVSTGVGLSPTVEDALPAALRAATRLLDRLVR